MAQQSIEEGSGRERAVLDSSAILAMLFGEVGADKILPHLSTCCMSTVNLTEVISIALKAGADLPIVSDFISRLGLEIIPFDLHQALAASSLQPIAREHNLSLGDRACLALGITSGRQIITGVREWARLSGFNIPIVLFR